MTTSFEPRTSDMLTVTELLELFDNMTGYGIDSYSREELDKVSHLNAHKHVTDAKTAQRMVEDYITMKYTDLNGHAPKTDDQRGSIVRCDRVQGATKYNRKDILRMLDDPYIRNVLTQEFHERTVLVQGVYIPTIVADTHPIDPANQDPDDWFL